MAHFYNYSGNDIPIEGLYKDQSCFLIVGGPSLNKLDLEKLNRPGIVTIGVNNSVRLYRPNIWISVDSPSNFMVSIWKDPKIQKVVMFGKKNKQIFDNTKWKETEITVGECPNVIYYRDNEHFKPTEEFLTEDTFNWGNHTDRCECGMMRKPDAKGKKPKKCERCGDNKWGARSVMLAATKLAYVLGFKRMFIIGADFKMDEYNQYAWSQNRSSHSMNSNNSTYNRLNERFDKLRPIFEKNNFYVFNSTPDSNLNSFPKIDFEDAVEIATNKFPDVGSERTFGMYERRAVEEKIKKEAGKITELKAKILNVNGSNVKESKKLKQKLEKSECQLKSALEERERILSWKE